MHKLVTAVAALQCVENGLIGLDEPLSKYLPELDVQEVIILNTPTSTSSDSNTIAQNTEKNVPFTLSPATKKITLRHLLTHTSGVGHEFFSPGVVAWRESRGESELRLAMSGDVIAGFSTPLVHEPGTAWAYGGGYDWTGLLIGRLNGMTFGRYMGKHIFKPLGMQDTTFHLDTRPDLKERLMTLSLRGDDSKLAPSDSGLSSPAKGDAGGVGLYSTSKDFAKLLGDLLKQDPILLKPETAELLFSPQLKDGSNALQTLPESDILWKSYFPADREILNHSLGGLLSVEDGAVPKGTLTWSGYTNPVCVANRERGLAWFFATQLLPAGDQETGKLCRLFGDLVLAGKATKA